MMQSKLSRHQKMNLPVYLQDWKRDYDESWRKRWKQYYETWDRIKESLPKRGEFTAARRAGVYFYPTIDLEEWK